MALFTKKQNTEEVTGGAPKLNTGAALASYMITPRVTEKATILTERNVYTFNIPKGTSKGAVKDVMMTLYKVMPVKVAIAKAPSKKVLARGKRGSTKATVKAYVYLKEGDKIDFV